MASSVYVKVNKSMKIVEGLDENVLVEEVVRRLSSSCRCTKPQVLLEVWNGCSRLFRPEEKLFDSLNKWGKQFRTVNLVMMDKEKYFNGSILGLEIKLGKARRRKFRKHSPFKISHKRLPIKTNLKLKKCLNKELRSKLQRLINETEWQKQCLNEVVNAQTSVGPSLQLLLALSPAMQGRYTTLANDIAKMKQMNKELEKHKKELKQTLANRKQEIQSLQKSMEDSQKQMRIEQTLLSQTQQEYKTEFNAIEQKLYGLQSRLKAKQKIIQLQSNKIQDMWNSKTALESQIQSCVEQTQSIKLSYIENLDIV